MRFSRVARSCGRLVKPRTLLAAAPRLGAAALVASLLAVAPGQGLHEPRRDGGVTDLVVPPGDVGDPPWHNLESLPQSRSSAARVAAYAEQVTATGIPERALQAYVRAAAALGRTDPECGLRWSLLAAIGRVESDHGRFGGRSLLEDGTSSSPILGLPLDGRPGLAEIRDTDDGRLDRDTEYDRAVGPMQFIPSTWARLASDGDGDGVRNPHDLDDAAVAAGRYLCAYGGLGTPEGLRAAILHYNPSSEYADLVLRIMELYERGLSDDLPRPGAVPTTEPAPKPPLPPANVEPAPTQQGSGADSQGGGTGGASGGGTGGTSPRGGHPSSPPSDGGSGGGSGGDSGGDSGGGSSSPTPTPSTNEPTPNPSPSDSSTPTPCPSPSDSTSPGPTPSPTPSATPTGDGSCTSGDSTSDPSSSPAPSP